MAIPNRVRSSTPKEGDPRGIKPATSQNVPPETGQLEAFGGHLSNQLDRPLQTRPQVPASYKLYQSTQLSQLGLLGLLTSRLTSFDSV